ncbi:ABC transporter ATP-binding protein [Lottiidibacillus patelloidae]|uniref:ABC transporter ATP-binding protein n=1 Tax=Lottiidibacillus patelloidae TaxID=2670334 RepID=UPI001E3C51FF|nr:ATP-binding cassette domain-containing protein [Lottiidibacillus patelloidae]
MIQVKGLIKKYGKLTAVNGVNFTVNKGEIFGLLGPNGAGKTTTIEMLVGLRKPDEGSATLGGYDVVTDVGKMKEVMGVQLQATSLFELLTVEELIEMYGSFYKKQVDIEHLIESMMLLEKKSDRVKNLSGGQKQRLAIALALVHDPDVVFLDEPTTGLDPQARRVLWDIILKLKEDGKTIVLTTHYMDEAHVLCDRIAIIDQGEIIALDTPEKLVKLLHSDNAIEFRVIEGELNWNELPNVTKVTKKSNYIYIYSSNLQETLSHLLFICKEKSIIFQDLHIRAATLEDVFISLTGRRLREE